MRYYKENDYESIIRFYMDRECLCFPFLKENENDIEIFIGSINKTSQKRKMNYFVIMTDYELDHKDYMKLKEYLEKNEKRLAHRECVIIRADKFKKLQI